MVVVGAIFLVGGKDVLILVSLLIIVVLRWVSILSSMPRPSHGFLSNFHRLHQMLLSEEVTWELTD